jgi:prophage DNA circulation protein
MSEQIFDGDGHYLAINADGSINTTTSLSANFDDVETILTSISGAVDGVESLLVLISSSVDGLEGTASNIYGELQSIKLGQQTYFRDYSRIVQTFGTDTYIAIAPIDTLSSDSLWQVQKIDSNGSRLWADSGAFTQPCSADLSGLTFAY